MLNTEVLDRLEALIAYCDTHADEENDWEMLHRLLTAVRGCAAYYPELKGLYEHVQPYIDERLKVLIAEEWEAIRHRSLGPDEGHRDV